MSESIWDDPRITAYVLGEMSDQERREFEIAIEANRELAAAVEEARTVTGQLALLYGDEEVPTLAGERRAAIVAGSTVSPARDGSASWTRVALVFAIAAALLLMVGVMPMMYRQHQERLLSMQSEVQVIQQAEELSKRQLASDASADEALSLQFGAITDPSSRPEMAARDNMAAGVAEESIDSLSVAARGLGVQQDDDLRSDAAEQIQRGGEARGSLRARSPISAAAAPAEPAGEKAELDFENEAGRPVSNYAFTAPAGPAPAAAAPAALPTRAGIELERKSEISMAEGWKAGEGKALNVEFSEEAGQVARPAVVESQLQEVESLKRMADTSLGESQRGVRLEVEPTDSKLRELSELDAAAILPSDASVVSEGLQKSQPEVRFRKEAVASADREVELEQRRFLDSGVDYGLPVDEGRGPGVAGDRFEPITDNAFQRVSEHPLSTFSVDVDTASYSKVRDYLMRANQLPRPDAVRIEELVNYFHYNYEPPADSAEHPFAARVSVTSCPWDEQHRLARIALKGKTMEPEDRPKCNLVFLLDTSGSMNAPNKLPLVIEGMQMLLKQLNENDQVAITVYAGSAGLVLDSTPVRKENKIRKALTELSAGGSTNGGAGITLAYQTARDHFIPEGVNRVILCTDGDFNVGTTGTDELVRMVENEAKGGVFLSVLGFGMGNHNDAMLEQVSGRGNGNYAFIDSREEARKVLVEQTNGTLVTIAKDVKLQIEFNPTQVSSYRLIGYENRILAKEDFNDDKKDAGEIGAGHSVTALYEIVPAGIEADANPPKVDDLKYQQPPQPNQAADSKEMMTLKLRYKQPDGDISTLVEFPVVDDGGKFSDADEDVRFAAAVASFGMQLRRSPYAGSWTLSDAMNVANRAKGNDRDGLRAEFVTLVQKASELMGEE